MAVGPIKGGHWILYTDYAMALLKFLCKIHVLPVGLTEMLTGAHMAVSVNWGSIMWVSL